jgi:hypothetical protein
MVSSSLTVLYVLLVPVLFSPRLVRAEYLRGVETSNIFVSRDDSTSAVFRILTVGSMIQDDGNSTDFSTKEEIACVPIRHGKEVNDDLYNIDLPRELIDAHREQILDGKLFVSISRAKITDDSVEILKGSHVQVISDPRATTRSVKPPAVGKKTVAVVLISTRDSVPSVSAQDLRRDLFSIDGVNLKTQFRACSSGQLDWELQGDRVLEVFVDEPVKNFKGGSALVTAAQKVMRTMHGIEDISTFADKTLMCLPPGTGNWVASSGVGHWRAQFNDGWCRSLSATMHELGHTVISLSNLRVSRTLTHRFAQLGLNHANEGGVAYGDSTGYMASGHKATDWPKKCFDGEKHWQLGWFFRRQQTLLTKDLASGRLIKLATFVDYDKSEYDEPVLVRIDDIFLQYNRAKEFNIDTEEKRDQVTITRRTGSGSDALAGLSQGDLYSEFLLDDPNRTLLIEACGKQSGNRGADVMVISVAVGRSLCDKYYANQNAGSLEKGFVNNHLTRVEEDRRPAPIVTRFSKPAPIISPSTSPSQPPTIFPTLLPSAPPTLAPTPAPTLWTPTSLSMVAQFWAALDAWRSQNPRDRKHDDKQWPIAIDTASGPAKVDVANCDVGNEHVDSGASQTTSSMASVLGAEQFTDNFKGKQNQSGVHSVFSSRKENR